MGLCLTKLGQNKVLNSNLGQVMRNRSGIITSHFLGPETKIYMPQMTGSTVCGKKSKVKGASERPYYFSFFFFFLFVLSVFEKKLVYSYHFQDVPPYPATALEGFEPASIRSCRCRPFDATSPST